MIQVQAHCQNDGTRQTPQQCDVFGRIGRKSSEHVERPRLFFKGSLFARLPNSGSAGCQMDARIVWRIVRTRRGWRGVASFSSAKNFLGEVSSNPTMGSSVVFVSGQRAHNRVKKGLVSFAVGFVDQMRRQTMSFQKSPVDTRLFLGRGQTNS